MAFTSRHTRGRGHYTGQFLAEGTWPSIEQPGLGINFRTLWIDELIGLKKEKEDCAIWGEVKISTAARLQAAWVTRGRILVESLRSDRRSELELVGDPRGSGGGDCTETLRKPPSSNRGKIARQRKIRHLSPPTPAANSAATRIDGTFLRNLRYQRIRSASYLGCIVDRCFWGPVHRIPPVAPDPVMCLHLFAVDTCRTPVKDNHDIFRLASRSDATSLAPVQFLDDDSAERLFWLERPGQLLRGHH
ncbi:hypothetical protein BJV77DRAFT_965444 [Russula vinacea]|nr:hypothetical protein BJV77DRAFT_965444 [Russula vinacea]